MTTVAPGAVGAKHFRPSGWIEKNLMVDEFTPFGFDGRVYLRPVHDILERRMLLKCGRQTEKSTSLCAKMLVYSGLVPTFKSLYISPSQLQAREFSHAKLNKVLKSPWVRRNLFNPVVCTDFVFEKEFLNGSRLLMNYAGDRADRVRGISADLLVVDELQDIMTDNLPVLEQTLAHSKWRLRVQAGTPKTMDNPIESEWRKSTQCEWLIPCEGCSHWNFQDTKIIGKRGPICGKCGKGIDPGKGKWVPGKPDADTMGFRVSQTQVPWIYSVPDNWKELVKQMDEWPEYRFANEVLGLSSEKGANIVTATELRACCGDRDNSDQRPQTLWFDMLYAGIDWGAGLGSYSILTVGGIHSGKFRVLFMKRFSVEKDEPEEQVAQICKILARMGVRLVACDWGAGFVQNKMLQERLANVCDVVQIYESNVKKRHIEWNDTSKMYVVNRQAILGSVFNDVKQQRIEFFKWAQFEEFASDFTCVFEEYNQSLRIVVYNHPQNIPDDALHSVAYAKAAGMISTGNPNF